MDKIRKEAYQVIIKVIRDHQKTEKLLDKSLKNVNSENDRAFLCHLVRGVVKLHKHLDYIAASFNEEKRYSKSDIKIKSLLYLGLYQLIYCNSVPDHSAVNETVDLAKQLFDTNVADYINAILRAYLRNPVVDYPENETALLGAVYSFDESLLERWLSIWGYEGTEELCKYFNEVPRLSIRVNNMATDKKRLLNYFQRKNISIKESEYSENILTSSEVYKVLNDVSFNEGYFSVQDSSAAMVVELMDPQQDESILDLFAGPGGKCTYTAELMHNTGEIIAVDRFPQKTKKIKQTLHRLQITNTQVVTEDALKFGPKAPAYDRVLLDVPCTGWGVMQKKPELRWQYNQDLKSLLKLQEGALSYGSGFVKEGGYLIYSTCTMNPEENEVQVEKFLNKHKNFSLLDANGYLKGKGKNLVSLNDRDGEGARFFRTIPHKDRTDGAFAAKMQRIG